VARSRRQQALYGEPAAPVSTPGPPALGRPRTEVEQLLNKQIALGEKILQMSQNGPNEKLKYIVETGEWRDYNRLLIKRCFTAFRV
jgi:hypothetical protein